MSLPNPAYVPGEFRQKEHSSYPSDNHEPFEEYFYNKFNTEEDLTERSYLPIFWTSYHRNNNYGKDEQAKQRLQNFIDLMPKDRKYYTIVQYDDGCIVDLSGIDIKVFSMAGLPRDYPLPLISMPHQPNFPDEERNLFASFVGRLTHQMRHQLIGAASKVRNDQKEWYVTTYNHSMLDYCRVLAKSVFSFCPRGYSYNSFRIQESLQYGAIPVIISDSFWMPHGLPWPDFAVMIHPKDILRIDTVLNSISEEEIKAKQGKIPYIYHNYFTFEANRKLIIKALNDGLA